VRPVFKKVSDSTFNKIHYQVRNLTEEVHSQVRKQIIDQIQNQIYYQVLSKVWYKAREEP